MDGALPITLELYQLLPPGLTELRRCAQCGKLFTECENMGRHLCRIHPGIRLLSQTVPRTVFYSCCSRGEHTVGCLQADHSACDFGSTASVETRVAVIRDFGTVLVPRILLRFFTRPLESSLLYDSRQSLPLFTHQFGALLCVLERTASLSIHHKAFHLLPQEVVEEVMAAASPEVLTSKTFHPSDECDALWQESKHSPLFIRLLQGTKENLVNEKVRQEWDNVWRNHITPSNSTQTMHGQNRPGGDDSCCEIAYIIVSRLHDKLDF